ncbi:nitroreductase family deazaflavin-dependent oxidoreductase [Actinomadura flavalba]|uniref:nitroreductase family deazaflavin-dependent oxidoreductase n=1 Tax=Actinomadura flavalba TaxID=1120938 RepID=UPI00037E2B40|nr:nitroreductase family deazaflavin-dependent oxidoreductase [Actinomadura flavalba]
MPDGRPRFFDSALFAPAMKTLTKAHAALYTGTGGRFGARFRFGSAFPRGVPVALLTTIGRKSGRPRTVALIAMPDGDRVVLVASRGGTPQHPQWYLNLLRQPRVRVRFGDKVAPMRAYEAEGDERADLWRRLVDLYPEYADYQKWTDRRIPVVVCAPE